MNHVQILPLRTILESFMNPGDELPEPFLDCQAFIMGSSPILDDPGDVDVCVLVPDLKAVDTFTHSSKGWEWVGDSYHDSTFVSIELQRALPINLICSDDKLFFEATHMAQEVMEWTNRRHPNAFTSRHDRVILFDLMFKTCLDKQEESEAVSDPINDDECPF
jgi:hypothetical protein